MDNMEVIWGLYIVKCGESGRLSLLFFSQNSSLDIWCSWGEMDLIDDIVDDGRTLKNVDRIYFFFKVKKKNTANATK